MTTDQAPGAATMARLADMRARALLWQLRGDLPAIRAQLLDGPAPELPDLAETLRARLAELRTWIDEQYGWLAECDQLLDGIGELVGEDRG
jgi:hypothetical protein